MLACDKHVCVVVVCLCVVVFAVRCLSGVVVCV